MLYGAETRAFLDTKFKPFYIIYIMIKPLQQVFAMEIRKHVVI